MNYRVLLIEDDDDVSAVLKGYLQRGQHQVDLCPTGKGVMDKIVQFKPDLVVMDLGLPDVDGLTLLSFIRKTDFGRKLPVMILSARKTTTDVVTAFEELGVEDYMLKPIGREEFLARINAVLRRRQVLERVEPKIKIGDVQLDPARSECRANGKTIDLNPREFELLKILMQKSGRVLTRSYLLETVWGMSSAANTRAVDVSVSRLRKLLGPKAAQRLQTVERVGYRFRDD